MKATKIYYKRLIGLGNFEHEQIGIELEVEEGERACDVLEAAKKFVSSNKINKDEMSEYRNALRVLANPTNNSISALTEASELIKKYNDTPVCEDDLPF